MAPGKSTAFTSTMAKLSLPFAVSCLAASKFSSPLFPSLPILFIGRRMLHKDPTSARDCTLAGRVVKLVAFGASWTAAAVSVGALLTSPFVLYKSLTSDAKVSWVSSWHALFIYTPFVIMTARPSRDHTYSGFSRWLFHLQFDLPLTTCAFLMREALNLRLLGPFATILDDDM
ncbi:hypothetical protein TeGR_g9083 [Tetraparma gracilis]|jgi:hypothetical protein|uniref:Uncharacterized protein n=1 Tax=Tetraparma gracilis TaxID=2962635 RepID=A0ABQ6N4C8_9STRA|nr:hypothetical protein TeGR_g9083 [Tetraparma gracilis]